MCCRESQVRGDFDIAMAFGAVSSRAHRSCGHFQVVVAPAPQPGGHRTSEELEFAPAARQRPDRGPGAVFIQFKSMTVRALGLSGGCTHQRLRLVIVGSRYHCLLHQPRLAEDFGNFGQQSPAARASVVRNALLFGHDRHTVEFYPSNRKISLALVLLFQL